ncbi:MAG: O-antigen ligase family protein, partial [Candidatus Hydrogenedentes bacterium]|nr:O-antigen ligase family protein [Candidatus Hydrogenedentota bacterium]
MEHGGTVTVAEEGGFDYAVPRRVVALDAARAIVLMVALVAGAAIYSFELTSFLHAKEAVLCIGLAVMALLVAVRGHFYWNGIRAFAPLWIFVGLGLVRAAVMPTAVASDTALSALRWGLILVTVALAYDLLAQEKWRDRVFDAFIASAVVVALLGYVQYWGLAPRLFPVFDSYDQRVYSVFGNQDYFGGYVAMAFPAALYRMLGQRRRKWGLAGILLLAPALLISGSRSAWLAALAGVCMVAPHLEWRPRRLAAAAIVAAAAVGATAYLAPEATVSRVRSAFAAKDEGRDSRVWLWKAGHGMFRDFPLMGMGLGNYAYWSPSYLGEIAANRPADPSFNIERHADQPHS